MPGTPMKRRVLAALQARAARECGEKNATIVDYVCSYVAAGHCMRELAELLAKDLGHPVSRSFVSWTVSNVTDDAKTRLRAARREAQVTTRSKAASCDERERLAHDRTRDTAAA